MNVKITKEEEVKIVKTELGEITEDKDCNKIRIEHDHYILSIVKRETGETVITLRWLIHRPDHDHNDLPSVQFIIPKDGACSLSTIPSPKGMSNRSGKIIFHPDGWMMDLLYDSGFGKPKVLFEFPPAINRVLLGTSRKKDGEIIKANQFSLMQIEKLLKEHGHNDAYDLIKNMVDGE